MSDPLSAITAVLKENGVHQWTIEHGGKHPRVVFDWRGRSMFYVFSHSPSDKRRAALNAERDLRRMLGVKRSIHKNPHNRKKNRPGRQAVPMPEPCAAVKEDPFAVLEKIRDPFRPAPMWDAVNRWAGKLT